VNIGASRVPKCRISQDFDKWGPDIGFPFVFLQYTVVETTVDCSVSGNIALTICSVTSASHKPRRPGPPGIPVLNSQKSPAARRPKKIQKIPVSQILSFWHVYMHSTLRRIQDFEKGVRSPLLFFPPSFPSPPSLLPLLSTPLRPYLLASPSPFPSPLLPFPSLPSHRRRNYGGKDLLKR